MPVFRFACLLCDDSWKKLLSKRSDIKCPGGCNRMISPELTSEVASVTKELRDPHRGVSLEKGHDKMMKKRMNQHHDKYDAERKIDEFGIDDAKRLGWDKKVKRV